MFDQWPQLDYTTSEATLTDLSGAQFSKFLSVAGCTLLAFDYCLTFSTEVEYVWGTKWKISRILFTLTRYLGLITSSLACFARIGTNGGCGGFVLALDVMYNASIIFAEGILILRTYAMWGCSKRILFLLLFLAAAFIAVAQTTSLKFKITLPGDSTSHYQFYPSLCAYRSSRNLAFDYGFLVAYEIILQSMSSWRKFRTYRDLRSVTLNKLYWDGIMYMFWIVVLSGANMIVIVTAPIAFIPSLDTAQVAIHSVIASRIFFNLKECDKQLHSDGDESTLDTLHFRASAFEATTQHAAQGQV